MTFSVDLELPELAVCKMLGNLRTFSARTVSSKATPFNRDGFEIDEDGFIGEYAFCKRANLFFDITAKPRRGGHDFIYKDKRVDMKTTRYINGHLIMKKRDKIDIDLVGLAIFTDTRVTFPGYISAADLFRPENINPRFGNDYAVGQNRLIKWDIYD